MAYLHRMARGHAGNRGQVRPRLYRQTLIGETDMQITSDTMCANEIRKAALLITKAAEIGMDISGYGHSAANPYSGNTYLWLEDYPFTLYIGPSGGDTIFAVWSNPDNGEEETT